jgi:hypothetical protein
MLHKRKTASLGDGGAFIKKANHEVDMLIVEVGFSFTFPSRKSCTMLGCTPDSLDTLARESA